MQTIDVMIGKLSIGITVAALKAALRGRHIVHYFHTVLYRVTSVLLLIGVLGLGQGLFVQRRTLFAFMLRSGPNELLVLTLDLVNVLDHIGLALAFQLLTVYPVLLLFHFQHLLKLLSPLFVESLLRVCSHVLLAKLAEGSFEMTYLILQLL